MTSLQPRAAHRQGSGRRPDAAQPRRATSPAPTPREVHPLVEQPIRWGDYPTERGVVGRAARRAGRQLPLAEAAHRARTPSRCRTTNGAWNTAPGDGFVPHGRRVYGPWAYTNATGIRDLSDPQARRRRYLHRRRGAAAAELDDVDNAARKAGGASPTGTGEFWCRIPSGKKSVVTKVENPSDKPARSKCRSTAASPRRSRCPPGQTATRELPDRRRRDGRARPFTADKSLVLLETSFE